MDFFICAFIGYLTLAAVPSAPATDAKNPNADVFHDLLIEPSKCHALPAQNLSRVEAPEDLAVVENLRQHTAKQPSSLPAATIELKNLAFDGEVLQGEVVNRNGPTATEVLVEVTFGSENDKAAVTQTFRVVPGGDGRTLSAGMKKHFRYCVKMSTAGQKISASGKVTKVLLAQDEKE